MGEEFDLRRAIGVVRARWVTVVVTTVLCAAAAFAWAATSPKRYEATSILLTGQAQGIADVGSIVEVNQAAQSLSSLATDRVVVEQAAKEIGYRGDVDDLLERVSAHVPPNTQEIELTVTSGDPKVAAAVANGIARTFSRLIEEKTSDESNLSAVVWQEAIPPKSPSGPDVARITGAALLLGLLLGIGFAFLREHLDGRWRSEADVEKALGLPVLGSVPDLVRRGATKQVYG